MRPSPRYRTYVIAASAPMLGLGVAACDRTSDAGAKTNPNDVIVFDAGGLFRAAQVASDGTITAGGDDDTLSRFGKLLSSTDPGDAKLANGNDKVIVKNGLVTSIRKSKK
ncbi:MAG: hypothetical protein ACRDHU_13480 [Actinomycetota bacterium]